MATFTLETLRIGAKNQLAGSDSLYDAFYKIKNNFAILANANFSGALAAGNGISLTTNPLSGVVTIKNTGAVNIVAGSGINVGSSNGIYTITNTGPGSGTVTSIGITSTTVNVSGSPITNSGNINIDLPALGVAGTYALPTVTIDNYGRVTNISNGNVSGGNVVANNITANNTIVLGAATLGWASTTTNSTALATIATISVANIVGAKFFVRGHDTVGGNRFVCTIDALTDGANVELDEYGGMSFDNDVGDVDVSVVSGNMLLTVTPSSANTTVWTTQYTLI